MSKRINRFANAPSLQQFIRKQQGVSLYRKLMKEAHKITSSDLRMSVQEQIRYEFRVNKFVTDSAAIKTALVEGNRSLKKVASLHASEIINTLKMSESTLDNVEDMRVGTGWPWEQN